MHVIINFMDDFTNTSLYMRHLPRRFPAALVVDNIGYLRHKTNWIQHRFASYNYSFILSGGGEYWRDGQCWPVRAPCVITQDPHHSLKYGPGGDWLEWEELFIIYHQDKQPVLQKMGLARPEHFIWQIRDSGPIRARLAELRDATARLQEPGTADRVDRLCELLVLESILCETRTTPDREEHAIQQIRDYVKAHPLVRHDFHALARAHGLSSSTFRRRWAGLVGPPPARYVMRLRMREACRLLVETRLKIGEIAAQLEFDDPLYFSRRFRRETGMPAAAYRRQHQSPLSLATDRRIR
ncbi:MAG: helix-turn-helix domain-containing protein [Kiritimatiellia bacterium]